MATSSSPRIGPEALPFVGNDLAREMRRRFPDEIVSDEYIAQIAASFETHRGKLRQLRDAGATLVVGSDSGSLGQFHHDAIWQELASWRAYGLSTEAVLAAATSVPARMLDRADVGALSAGDARRPGARRRGRLERSPFERDRVRAVVKGGVIYVEDSKWVGPGRDEMVARIESFATTRD